MTPETKLPAAPVTSSDAPRRAFVVRSHLRAGTATVTIRPAKTPRFRSGGLGPTTA